MRFLLILFLVGSVHSAAAFADTDSYMSSKFPQPDLILRWTKVLGISELDLPSLPRAEIDCKIKKLYPSHPQQSTKQYHVHKWGSYDVSKISGDDDLCKMGQKKFSGKKPACFRTLTPHYMLISDYYVDRCGNHYRGFFEKAFMNEEDNDGTLLSLGRVQYIKDEGGFKEARPGPTYELERKDFVFLSPATPEQIEKTNELRQQALVHEYTFNEDSFLFTVK